METPIADFVKEYTNKQISRFHMPGHKGQAFLGCEDFDITEIAGADALYEADGIISESEKNATELFGTKRTVFSTEGSSQCIRAMMHLLVGYWKTAFNEEKMEAKQEAGMRPYVLAARNVHKAFLYAAALVDFDVIWLYPEEMHSLCSCIITTNRLEEELMTQINSHGGIVPAAVYVTSPDYLGGNLDIASLAKVCHRHNTLLAVDNAHGAYLHFLEKSGHPMDLGADICCDSAHKTLPVLTGGAYLHISKHAPGYLEKQAKHAMAFFGSTSPSYLTLVSLDLCNAYLAEEYRESVKNILKRLHHIKEELRSNGWNVKETDPLKLTLETTDSVEGNQLAEYLRKEGIECEYSDGEFVVFMVTPENPERDFTKLCHALITFDKQDFHYEHKKLLQPVRGVAKYSVREAVFAEQEMINVEDSLGRICGIPTVGCPPAIPVVVAGEIINENAVRIFQYYGIRKVSVIKA